MRLRLQNTRFTSEEVRQTPRVGTGGAKAAEGSRTPRRFAHVVDCLYRQQVLECGGARPEGPLPLSSAHDHDRPAESRGRGEQSYALQAGSLRSSRLETCATVLLALVLWSLNFGLGTASAAPTNALDEASFNMITKNNIFNPRRRGYKTPAVDPGKPHPIADWFALVGIMNYDKGLFAFFEGSKSDYTKVEKPGDKIADFKVETIETAMVKLSRGTNTIMMPVNMQMRREEGGDWKLAPRSETYVTSSDRGDRSRNGRNRNYRNGQPNSTPTETPAPGPEGILSAVQQMIQDGAPDAPPPPDVILDQGPDNGGDTNEDPVLRALRLRRERENNP